MAGQKDIEGGSSITPEKNISDIQEIENVAVTEPKHPIPVFGYEAATEEEKALDKSLNFKTDSLVVIICAINFLLQGIDKSNIGNAATTSFAKDAHLEPNNIPNSISLLACTFVTLQPISTVLARKVGPNYWIPAMMLGWGAVCMAQAGINGTSTLYATRLLLGAFEAGFVPTVYFYLSTLYPHYMLGFRLGLFAGCYSIAGAFSGLIAYGIFHINNSRYHDWQLLFLIEGGITVLMAIVTFLVLPKKLCTAWFLTQAERDHALRRLEVDNPTMQVNRDNIDNERRFNIQQLKDALCDWRKLLLITLNILATLPVYVFGVFMPLIVGGMGYTQTLDANLMSVSPFVVGAIGLFISVYISDKFHERSLVISGSMLLSLVGFIVLTVSKNNVLRYVFLHICLAGASNISPLLVAWLTDNTPESGKRSVIIGLNGYSNLSGVIAGQLFKSQYAPSYYYPLTVTMVLICVGLVGFLAMRVVYMLTNRSRAKKLTTWSAEDYEAEKVNPGRRGDMKLTFLYGY